MKALDARLIAALRASSVHLPATDLAGQLAAPLATVEARLTELRGAGFEIEERPGLGFRLLSSPDRLIADEKKSDKKRPAKKNQRGQEINSRLVEVGD